MRQKWRSGSTAFLASGILIVIIAASWYVRPTRRADEPATRARELTRLTFGQGLQTDVTWSPDGQRIAFASNQEGNFDIWVQRLGGEAVRITSSPADDTQPAWSPIGDEIVFHSERDGGGLFIVPAAGGPARPRTAFGAYPTWRADGGEILFFASKQAWPMRDLYAVSPHGDDMPRQILSDFLRDGFWEWMAPHPDGRLTFMGVHRSQDWGVYTVGQDGKDPVTVHPSDALLQTLGWPDTHQRRFQWNRAGTALYLEVASNDITNLWKVGVAPVTLEWLSAERLTTGADDATVAAVAPDDERLAFTIQHEKIRGWVFPFDAEAGPLIGDGRPVTAEDAVIANLRLSADGQSLLYDSHRAGTKTVAVMTTDVDTGKTTVLKDNARGPCRVARWHARQLRADADTGQRGHRPRPICNTSWPYAIRLAQNASWAAGAGPCGSPRPTGPAMVRVSSARTGIPRTSDQFFSSSCRRRRPSRPSQSASYCGLPTTCSGRPDSHRTTAGSALRRRQPLSPAGCPWA